MQNYADRYIPVPEVPWAYGPPDMPDPPELSDETRTRIIKLIDNCSYAFIPETIDQITALLMDELDPMPEPFDERAEPEYWKD